jgi:hypothetical protein
MIPMDGEQQKTRYYQKYSKKMTALTGVAMDTTLRDKAHLYRCFSQNHPAVTLIGAAIDMTEMTIAQASRNVGPWASCSSKNISAKPNADTTQTRLTIALNVAGMTLMRNRFIGSNCCEELALSVWDVGDS